MLTKTIFKSRKLFTQKFFAVLETHMFQRIPFLRVIDLKLRNRCNQIIVHHKARSVDIE